MNRRCIFLCTAAATVVAGLSISRPAHALGPVDLEIAARAGYASNPTGYAPNILGASLGARAGVSFLGFYGGLTFLYDFGGTTVGTDGEQTGPQTVRSNQFGVELGYGWKLRYFPLTIRPQLGLGDYTYTTSGVGFCGVGTSCGSQGLFYVEPGVTALIGLGRHFFIGADVSLFILPNVPTVGADGSSGSTVDAAVAIHGQVGVKF